MISYEILFITVVLMVMVGVYIIFED